MRIINDLKGLLFVENLFIETYRICRLSIIGLVDLEPVHYLIQAGSRDVLNCFNLNLTYKMVPS